MQLKTFIVSVPNYNDDSSWSIFNGANKIRQNKNQSFPSLPNFEEKDNSSNRQSNSKNRKSK